MQQNVSRMFARQLLLGFEQCPLFGVVLSVMELMWQARKRTASRTYYSSEKGRDVDRGSEPHDAFVGMPVPDLGVRIVIARPVKSLRKHLVCPTCLEDVLHGTSDSHQELCSLEGQRQGPRTRGNALPSHSPWHCDSAQLLSKTMFSPLQRQDLYSVNVYFRMRSFCHVFQTSPTFFFHFT